MAAITASSFRTAVALRLADATNANYPTELLDEAGKASMQALFPAVYQLVETTGLVPDANGSVGVPAGVNVRHVTEVVDEDTNASVLFWSVRGSRIIGLSGQSTVTLISFRPFTYPSGSTSIEFPEEFVDVLYGHAEVVAIESVMTDMATFRGYRANSREGMPTESELGNTVTVLSQKYSRMLDDRAMSLPLVVV